MKFVKKFILFITVIVVLLVVAYGYSGYRKYALNRELNLAREYYNKGDLSSAVQHLSNILDKAKGSESETEVFYYLGKCYLSLDELDKAKEYWESLKSKSNNYDIVAETYFSLAIIDKETGNLSSSVKNYEKVIESYDNSDLADDAIWNLAVIYKMNGELEKAKQMLDSIIENYPQSNLIGSVQKELGEINIGLLFSPKMISGSEEYIIQKGDTLVGIAQKFGTTVDLLKTCNKLESDIIRPGDRLKVVTGKFSIVVDKTRNTLILKIIESGLDPEEVTERVIKIYNVGTGTGGSTPEGEFTVNSKLINPPWYKAGYGAIPFGDKRNILGTRWLGFNSTGYGIHGTWDPESIGKQSSAGCVRMHNKDVEELYKILSIGSKITIVE